MNKDNKISHCTHLNDLLTTEQKVINAHLDRHKWYTHETNDTKATIDFIKKYGEEMRIEYCANVCPYRNECKLHELYKNKVNELKNPEIDIDIRKYGSLDLGETYKKL